MRRYSLRETNMGAHRACLQWDGVSTPLSIEQVWSYLTVKLREFRESMTELNELLYGRYERSTYIKLIHSSLKEILTDHSKQRITNQTDLTTLLRHHQEGMFSLKVSPRKLENAMHTLQTFTDKVCLIEMRLTALRSTFELDILQQLDKYCSNHVSLGIADDDFYSSLQARNLSMNETLHKFDKLMEVLHLQHHNVSVPKGLFTDYEFSLEISLDVNTETFPILRVLPDLMQKLENLCDDAQDWLRSDKIYPEQVQKEIEQTKTKLADVEGKAQMLKLKYDKVYSIFKQKKSSLDDNEDTSQDVLKDISRLEANKSKLDMDIAAVQKTLKNNRASMDGMSSASTQGNSNPSVFSGRLLSRRASDENGKVVSAAHSSYMTRLYSELQSCATKLEVLQQKRKKLCKTIEGKKSYLMKHESTETELQQLGRRLRDAARSRSKLTKQSHSLRSRINVLEQLLRARLRPGSTIRQKAESPKHTKVLGSKYKLTKLHMPNNSRRSGHGKSKRSADLNKAFRLVKNSIGHGWKDLARSLPYSPAKELIEINNEIRAIEYENQGQLKEQALQALVQWYGHCGRKVSVLVLCDTLRELNENRLADNIERNVLKLETASDLDRAGKSNE